MTIISNAKINLGLNIIEKLPNGYHSLDMIMVPISLADKMDISFNKHKGDLKITSNIESIPTDERNILYKIYKKFYEATKIEPESIDIYLEKNIPHEAGLGGGSSNGGFFLKELNKFHNFILNEEELIKVGKSIGADIPFFLKNTPCRVKGIGEKLQNIKNNLDCDVILIKPEFGVSTKEAYDMYSKLENKKFADIEKIISGLEENDLSKVSNNIENMLEQSLLISDENIQSFRKKIEDLNIKFFMSGSGSCYFILSDKKSTESYLEILKQMFKDCKIIKCNFI